MSFQNTPTTFSWLSDKAEELMNHLTEAVGLLPEDLQIDGNELEKKQLNTANILKLAQSCDDHLIANWYSKNDWQISLDKPGIVKQCQDGKVESFESVAQFLKPLPFEVCIGGAIYSDWLSFDFEHAVRILPGQYSLGWLLVFKGEGHKHLVSKRWLDYSPVKVTEQGDTTFIQFHALSVDGSSALEQAVPGWTAFNGSSGSGFLPKYLKPQSDKVGHYDAVDGSMSVTVIGRDPSAQELQEACVARNFRGLADGREIKKLMYVFMEPERAQKNLHQLWLREIECHTFIDGKEINLTEGYTPPAYEKPEWVLRSD